MMILNTGGQGGGVKGGAPPPLVQISTPTPPSGLEGTPPLFLSQGESFYDDTVKSPWRLDFGVFVHHLWKFSAAASLQFSFLTAMHDENRYQYYGLVLSNLENLTDLVWLGYMASSYTCCFNWLLFCNIWFSSMGIDFIWNYYNLFWKITPNSKKVGTKQGTQLAEAKALRSPSRLNFPAAVISYCKTKKIKWLIFLLMWWNPLYGCCA